MLTIDDCTRLLGEDAPQSKRDAQAILDGLYALARIAITDVSQGQSHPPFLREAIEERAAILEFEAGLNREEADRLAPRLTNSKS